MKKTVLTLLLAASLQGFSALAAASPPEKGKALAATLSGSPRPSCDKVGKGVSNASLPSGKWGR